MYRKDIKEKKKERKRKRETWDLFMKFFAEIKIHDQCLKI